MPTLIDAALSSVWGQISVAGATYRTPDITNGSPFTVTGADMNSTTITTSGGNRIKISREQFHEAIRYLVANGHLGNDHTCEIRANLDDPGPLDSATRSLGNGTMVISYILPMLASTGIVGIDGNRPNTTWINL